LISAAGSTEDLLLCLLFIAGKQTFRSSLKDACY